MDLGEWSSSDEEMDWDYDDESSSGLSGLSLSDGDMRREPGSQWQVAEAALDVDCVTDRNPGLTRN